MGYIDDLAIVKKAKKAIHDVYPIRAIQYLVSPYILKKRLPLYQADHSPFLRLNIGCLGKRTMGYVNIDAKRMRRRVIILPFSKLPFKKTSVKEIIFNPAAMDTTKESFMDIMGEWKRVLVPGARVIIATDVMNSPHIISLCRALEKDAFVDALPENTASEEYFVRKFIFHPHKNKNYMVKREHFLETGRSVLSNEHIAQVYTRVTGKKVLIFGGEGAFLEAFRGQTEQSFTLFEPSAYYASVLEESMRNLTQVTIVNGVLTALPFKKNAFDDIVLAVSPETFHPDEHFEIYQEIQRVLKEKGKLHFYVRHERQHAMEYFIQFFDKARLVELIDSIGGFLINRIETIECTEGETYVYGSVEKEQKKASYLFTRRKKICALGEYSMLQLSGLGFHWDGQSRAFEELGLDYLLIDSIRNKNKQRIIEQLKHFKPDYILIGLREGLTLIKSIYEDIKQLQSRIIYWYCDPSVPEIVDFSNIIDCMFLTNAGQIPEYKKAYGVERIYYLPQAFSPYVIFPYVGKETIDIGFAGAVTQEPLHKTRRECLRQLEKSHKIMYTNVTRNRIAEFYSRSKLVFGASDFPYELYTSNRFFIALGAGAAYLCKKFEGIERLVTNKKHVIWFEAADEIHDLAAHYMRNDRERHALKQQAAQLGLERHTYTQRMQNMLDIVEGKTEAFYGFLQ